MATKPVRVEFMCDNPSKLYFTHRVPASLVDNAKPDPSDQDSQFMNAFVDTVKPIISEHYGAAYEATQPLCSICEAPKFQVSMTPMSFLHRAEPLIVIMAIPACNKRACDGMVRQNVQILMAGMHESVTGEAPARDPTSGAPLLANEVKACIVCHTIDNTSRCARCGIAFYCGREHQKMDWPFHKETCQRIARGN